MIFDSRQKRNTPTWGKSLTLTYKQYWAQVCSKIIFHVFIFLPHHPGFPEIIVHTWTHKINMEVEKTRFCFCFLLALFLKALHF